MLTVRYNLLGLRAGERVLDFGCGGGRHSFEAMRLGATVTALDANPKELEEAAAWVRAMLTEDKQTADAGGQGHVVAGDGLALPFPDGCFDRVIAAEVLEHIAEDSVALSELARVLRPRGVIAVTVPRWYPEVVNWALSREYHNVPGGHLRIYRRSVLARRLRDAGLQPFRYHHAHALHTPYWWLRCGVGISRDNLVPVRAYHSFLVWHITAKPAAVRFLEAILNPVLGKSLVVYARKVATP
ncbi:MAG TPA: class I SAM-dependent methyltransferase [Acidimicrobiales bacterium]|nr:class I SAM-dependent methyltransferase [Acidimicrobiales bacterium]